jgi:hypothetical protein
MHNSYFDRILTSTDPLTERDLHTTRRNIILPLLGALSAVLPAAGAHAGAIDSSETQVDLPNAIKWDPWINGFPPHSGEMAILYGGLDKPGPYLVRAPLIRDRPAFACSFRHMVGEQRRRLRSGQRRSCSSWWICQARGAYAAL